MSKSKKNTKTNSSKATKKIKKGVERVRASQITLKKKIPISQRVKTSNPEIQVKRANYSKTLRLAVLASATARQRLIEMGGENTINIIRDFDKDMSDEELARKTNVKASDVRVVLNRLHSHGLFAYTRVRDRDSGWYSYIWRMSENRLKEFSDEIEVDETERTTDNEGDKYRCARCSPDECFGFEGAMDMQFKCGKCGSELEFLERKKR